MLLKEIFDCGEIGWSYFHSAHLKWVKKVLHSTVAPNQMDQYEVWTFPDREKLYKGFADKIQFLPASIREKSIIRNGFGILRWGKQFYPLGRIRQVMAECGVSRKNVIHKFDLPKGEKPYVGQMLLEPFMTTEHEAKVYQNEIKHRDKKNIVLFPRLKTGFVYYDQRNWPEHKWKELIKLLLEKTDFNLIICGNREYTYTFTFDSSRVVNLSTGATPLENTIAALNDKSTILSVSTQSFGPTLSLLQNQNTLVWGHDKVRLDNDVGYPYRYSPLVKYRYIEGNVNIYVNMSPRFLLNEILVMTG